jgi:hypothetical protein
VRVRTLPRGQLDLQVVARAGAGASERGRCGGVGNHEHVDHDGPGEVGGDHEERMVLDVATGDGSARADEVTDPLGVAVRGVQVLRAVDERPQVVFEVAELADGPVDLG